MRIALVHSFYRSSSPSGENQAVLAQAEALGSAGHSVEVFSRESDVLKSQKFYGVRSGVTVMSGVGPDPLRLLSHFNPDVIHIHNLFPNWGSRWLSRATRPVVLTVHNYRLLCAAGTLSKSGTFCDLCVTGSSLNALRFGCYKGSALKTLPLAVSTAKPSANPILRHVNLKIFLSARSKSFFDNAGIGGPSEIVPNFVVDNFSRWKYPGFEKSNWLYVGRLSTEKGILQLIEAWPREVHLTVIGDGPLRESCERHARGKKIAFLGSLPRDQVLRMLPIYSSLVFPSVNPENSSLTFIEALSAGLPVLARSGNSASDDVRAYACGDIYETNLDLEEKILAVETSHRRFSSAARELYVSKYSEDAWTKKIYQVYSSVVRTKR